MKILRLLTLLLITLISCKNEKNNNTKKTNIEAQGVFNDSSYVLDSNFSRGDARRYGVTAETAKLGHPFTKKSRMTTVLDLAEREGIEISFPSGYYGMDLILDSRKNMNMRFNDSEFSLIRITQTHDSLPIPENLVLKGTLISYNRLGLTEAKNISIDSIIIKSDTDKNLTGRRSRGCHIYHGCEDIKIKYLEINDLGSGVEKYKYTHAALAIDGWNNNPVNVQIKKIHIKSTDRHGIYITGRDHLIGDVIIDKFGVGSSDGMDGMQDATKGEEKEFKALWVNKCYDSFIENITINEKGSRAKYTTHFDAGDKTRPFTIGNLKIINDNPNINILEEEGSAVVLESKEIN